MENQARWNLSLFTEEFNNSKSSDSNYLDAKSKTDPEIRSTSLETSSRQTISADPIRAQLSAELNQPLIQLVENQSNAGKLLIKF